MRRAGLRVVLAASLLTVSASHAATYYVRNGGDDSADGLSHDTAWATLDRVRDFDFTAGDRIVFHEGDQWQGQLVVDWPGTADKQTIVGAYHLENGSPAWGFTTGRPVIDGSDEIPEQYDGLIRVSAGRVRIENLEVVNSEGRGIQFENAADGEVVNCIVSNAYKSGIKFVESDRPVISGNDVTDTGRAHPEDGAVWGGAIALVASHDGYISNNAIWETYGEGVNVNGGSTGTVIENNNLFATRAVGIYLDAAPDTTVRRNFVVGTSNSEFWRGGDASGAGIALNNERYHYTSDGRSLAQSVQTRGARIYANLVAGTSSGIAFWGQLDATSFEDVLVLNNTFVDNDVQVRAQGKPKPGSHLINNILLSLSSGTRDVDGVELGGMSAASNYLSQGDPGGDWRDPGNRYQGITLARMTGWRSLTRRNQMSWRDFEVQPDSTVIGNGSAAPREMSQGDNTYTLDFNEQPFHEPMSMGALRFSSTPFLVPKKPTEVRGTP